MTPILKLTYDLLNFCANEGLACPSNEQFLTIYADHGISNQRGDEIASSSATVQIIQRLETMGLIVVERYQRGRRVTITATGKSTMEPSNKTPHWRESGLPTVSETQLREREPTLAQAIMSRARDRGMAPVDYLAHLTFKGWQAENGNA